MEVPSGRRGTLLALLLFGAWGCAHARPGALAIHWVRTSAEYRALCLQTYAAATRAVEASAAGRPARSWTVILDADETVLDNSLYQKERSAQGRGYSVESWDAWVKRREAGDVPGSRAFLEKVRSLGGVVAIVTNRSAAQCDATRANLAQLALPFDVVLCQAGPSSDKQARFGEVAQGREVLAWVGDNIRDFPDGSQALRASPEAELARFGSRVFVLPNPMYGSWEKNPDR